ncbi:M20/M25/M40 family metallo-hydrolase [Salsipaludibacter albus]|uniref:M20/M25/M40 family metallo-hydrolase n=1 Tax=Salsipaludibacter albus TaxID=2849650 RepID=UPI001EE4B48C|nr:M20/M25/M40 family metallo-hydrolase [Salsipaludibacter albus]MBY5163251.1 M20/M25/M40 family metallo-hydrolase [Salsipaludibacter albus]
MARSTRSDTDVVDLASTLVSIDSVNPALAADGAGEDEIAQFVVEWAAAEGLGATAVPHAPGRTSVLVRSGPGDDPGRGRTLVLCGHLDTVGVEGMDDPFGARREGQRLHGRGAYDMKAGLAAALVACRDFAHDNDGGEVVVAAVADEEHASLGIRGLLADLHADAAIVTEPTELAVAVAHKGFVWSQIEVVGQAAHGSRPQLGRDANLDAGPVLVALAELDRRLADRTHPLLGPASIHPTMVLGGVEASTIPAVCHITVERRTLPGETLQTVERELDELLDGCRRDDPTVQVSHRTLVARDPLDTDPDTAIAHVLATHVAEVLDHPAEVGGVSYWADSAFLAAAGIPTVVFGPVGDGAHAAVEWVDVESTVDCARVLAATARGFCAAPTG